MTSSLRTNNISACLYVVFSVIGCILLPGVIIAQVENPDKPDKIYKINPWVDSGIIVGTTVLTVLGLNAQERLPLLTIEEVLALDPLDVNPFDRRAIYQDPSQIDQSLTNSDIALNITTALVVVLALDKKARQHWLEGLVMYAEAIGISTSIQAWVSYGTNRYRPIAYMEGVSIEKRTDHRNKNSFYSGHSVSAATSSFFIAKVYSDLHPELGNKKYWLFAAAIIPPAVVGRFRVKGGKHFYTDIIIGTAMGAVSGILTPHLHKISRNSKMSFVPLLHPEFLGMRFKMKL